MFPSEGAHLRRYASVFNCVEINSCFYRPHRPSTYARWRETVPDDFRFSLKIPKSISHERRLRDAREPLERFLEESAELQQKRGVLLLQLPPSFAYDDETLPFFAMLRSLYDGPLAFEPRHATWFEPARDPLLRNFRISRVAADPALAPEAALPAGDPDVRYFRWHGSPRVYYDKYDDARLRQFAAAVAARGSADTWCIFDNTAFGAAAGNARDFQCVLT